MSVGVLNNGIHRLADHGAKSVARVSRSVAVFGMIATAPGLGGCSMSFPISPLMPASDDITGSLGQVPFGRLLEEEDRRREKAALATALDPQGDGSTIHWENAKTNHKGSITPVGHAYPSDGKVCRAFLSDLMHDGLQKTVQGTACTISAGEWVVRDSRPFTKA